MNYQHSPMKHVRIYVSPRLHAYAALRAPELVMLFAQSHEPMMLEFCKECEDPAFERDVFYMLLTAYGTWHQAYRQTTRGDMQIISEDVHTYASQLCMNYYLNKSDAALTLVVDMFPSKMMGHQSEYAFMMQCRTTHEGVLNSIH